MSNTESRGDAQMLTLWRTPIVVTAVICGIMALVGLAMALYTMHLAPNIDLVSFYDDQHIRRYKPKWMHIFVPALFLLALFLTAAYYSVRWKRFIGKARKPCFVIRIISTSFECWISMRFINWCALRFASFKELFCLRRSIAAVL